MELDYRLEKNIPFEIPTPIQRKALPFILDKYNVLGIARTGSGKTLCYLIPAIQNAILGKNTLIFVPTKELKEQVKKVLKKLTYKIYLEGTILITTPKKIENYNFDLFVVDEIDRILDEKCLRDHFNSITGFTQKIFFSATKPTEFLEMKVIEVESKIPANITHNFLYVPYNLKDQCLFNIMELIKDKYNKCIVFCATRYSVNYLILLYKKMNYKATPIYSLMDDEARMINFNKFISGECNILVVTDVAARGLDIPSLDISISYDLADEKTFVHRVGRIRGVGAQYSICSYTDIFHYFNIRETHLNNANIGTVPMNLLSKYNFKEFENEKFTAERGYTKCLQFRPKVKVPDYFKYEIDNFKTSSLFNIKNKLADQIKEMRARKIEFIKKEDDFRDLNFIPYTKENTRTHSSKFIIKKDDYIKK